jgi:hypothetical protein
MAVKAFICFANVSPSWWLPVQRAVNFLTAVVYTTRKKALEKNINKTHGVEKELEFKS